jgi:hypothetical protein
LHKIILNATVFVIIDTIPNEANILTALTVGGEVEFVTTTNLGFIKLTTKKIVTYKSIAANVPITGQSCESKLPGVDVVNS